MLMLGEVSTGFLRHSTPVSGEISTTILRLRPGDPVRWSKRPIAYAVSPERGGGARWLEGRPPSGPGGTLLRWVAIGVEEADPAIPANPAEPPVTFTIDGDLRRTLVIRVALADEPDRAARIVALCEDIA